jgi:DNA-binding transcriptional LysR family regulator
MFHLRQIECFVAVAEELHFGRAAARLHMTQPPLSRQIRLLEHELKIDLFSRTSRTVRITAAGSVFLPEARRILALAANAASAAQRTARGEAGLINLGFTAGSSYSFLPRLIAHTNLSLRHLDVVLHEMLTRDQIEALHGHTVDVSILRRTPEATGIKFVCVAREIMVVAVPRGHRLSKGRAPTLGELEGESFITFSPVDGPYFHELVERMLKNAGVQVNCIQRVGQIHSILSLVSTGQGIALVPQSAQALRFDHVILRKLKMRPEFSELFMAWKMDNPNPALPIFLKSVLREFAIRQAKNS